MLNIELNSLEKTLSFDEFQERYAWFDEQLTEVKLSGIEPLVHPQIIEIAKQISEKYYCAIYTKLDCETQILKELLKIKKIKLIIIPSDTPTNKTIANLKYLQESHNQIKSKKIWISIFLDFKTENDYIKNTNSTFEFLKHISQITKDILIKISPDEKNYENINSTKTQITSLYQTIVNNYPHIVFFFICSVNNCIFKPNFLGELLECKQIKDLKFICKKNKIFIDVKGKIKYCFYSKTNKLERTSYKSLKNLEEARLWFDQKKFKTNKVADCIYKKENKNCFAPICKGTCAKETKLF